MTSGDEVHPADLLIHEIVSHPRTATEQEIRLITDRIATVPFNRDIQDVPASERGRKYLGVAIGRNADSLFLHLVRRVVGDKQWAVDTTVDEYVESRRRAVRDPQARLALYQQWGAREMAAVIAPTRNVLGPGHIGQDAEPNIIVIYNATRGILTSGYQFSMMGKIHIPDGAIWLK